MNNFLAKLEKKYGRYAIKNLIIYVLAAYGIGYVLLLTAPTVYSYLELNPALVMKGQVWRLITWVCTVPESFSFFILFMFMFQYFIGSSLEKYWGSFRYNCYVFSGIFFMIVTLSLSNLIPQWMQVAPSIQPLASLYFFIIYLPMLPRAASIIFGTTLRAAGDTKTPMRVGICVNVINIVLNFLLIFPARTLQIGIVALPLPGANLGVIGAAVASAIAFTFGGIYMTVALWRHPIISPKGQKIKPDMQILKPCLKVTVPNMLQRFGTSLGYVAFASMVNSSGDISTAAHTIANTVESAFYIPGYGMQTAAATLAGNALGAYDNRKMKNLTRVSIQIEVLLMILSGSLLFLFAPNMMTLFTKDPAVITLGATVLRMVAVSEPFYGVSIIIEGIMQGVGETVTPFKFNILGMWGIRIVGTFICTQMLGLNLVSAWACMITHNLLLFLLFVIYYKKGSWNPMNKKTA